ncbi:hydrolase 1, exosortase A system-associated [Massilia sp. Se16.2.3]|uniref:hydrolase 1, exosortase A system-associated n=1 Tax=Massilia sp. Se16.2.3 TaxID=2709303 RepID=UPI001E434AC7|nr:hydrolase 1, exosortase A system-associated [Massilia sp. Se16.2.3]
MLVVVGGPQYRAGSHRQFTLLARDLADAGIPALRFDYRGMGDSEGDLQTFEHVEDDLRAAIDRFFLEVPGMREVVLWGLCDGASAAAMYAPQDARVSGLVLLNPGYAPRRAPRAPPSSITTGRACSTRGCGKRSPAAASMRKPRCAGCGRTRARP